MKPKSLTFALCAAAAGTLLMHQASTSPSGPVLTPDKARAIVTPLYEALNEPAHKDVDALLKQVTSDDFMSCSTEDDCLDRGGLAARFKSFGEIIPDLHWRIKGVWVPGNEAFVRAEATGTPVRAFLGLQPTGRSFKTMSIDSFTIKNGKITRSYHVENWIAALRQLGGN